MRRADCDFRYHPEASKNFLMESLAVASHPLRLPSSFYLSWFVSDSAANDETRDAVIARLAKAAWDNAQSLGQ
jgi:hypothetical protein